MVLFELEDLQPDEECEGCCICAPENCPPSCRDTEPGVDEV